MVIITLGLTDVAAPVHPVNLYPATAAALTVTCVPALWVEIPDGDTAPPALGLASTMRV
jgi:hypothetical protein